MSLERKSPQYKAFIPDNIRRSYHQLNSSNNQGLLDFMKLGDVYAFEIVDCRVVKLDDGRQQEQQTRRFVKLTTNGGGELSYLDAPNRVRLVDRGSKPLYLTETILDEIEDMKKRAGLLESQLAALRSPTRKNVWAALMEGIGEPEEDAVEGPKNDTRRVCFVVTAVGKTKNETIDIYLKAILGEIDNAEKEVTSSNARIICHGLVRNETFLLAGLKRRLQKLGYTVQINDLSEGNIGSVSHKKMLVEKTLK